MDRRDFLKNLVGLLGMAATDLAVVDALARVEPEPKAEFFRLPWLFLDKAGTRYPVGQVLSVSTHANRELWEVPEDDWRVRRRGWVEYVPGPVSWDIDAELEYEKKGFDLLHASLLADGPSRFLMAIDRSTGLGFDAHVMELPLSIAPYERGNATINPAFRVVGAPLFMHAEQWAATLREIGGGQGRIAG